MKFKFQDGREVDIELRVGIGVGGQDKADLMIDGYYVIMISPDGTFSRIAHAEYSGIKADARGQIVEAP